MVKSDLIVFTQYPSAYAPNRLSVEANKLGLTTKVISYASKDLNDVKTLPSAKYMILREPDARKNIYSLRDAILNHYVNRGSNVLNQNSYAIWSVLDKQTQHQEFRKAGIPHLKPLNLEDAKYPFVAKHKLGSHGSHVFKIEDEKDLENLFNKGYKKEDLLLQEFQTSGFDLRVIVVGGKVLGIMQRTPKKGSFLSNFSQGGHVQNYRRNDINVISEIALHTCYHFKLDYAGVDLMIGNDSVWNVLEVNRGCQFKGFEEATGVNVARKLIDLLTN